jgi:hypothetical protein
MACSGMAQSIVRTRIVLPPYVINLAHHGCKRLTVLPTADCNWVVKGLRRPRGNPKYLQGPVIDKPVIISMLKTSKEKTKDFES